MRESRGAVVAIVLAACSGTFSSPESAGDPAGSSDAAPAADAAGMSGDEDAAPVGLIEHVVLPADTDPRITRYLDPHYAYLDTRVAPRGRLVVLLGGVNGNPEGLRLFLLEAAALGHHAIGLEYANDFDMLTLCANSRSCYGSIRHEELDGQGANSPVTLAEQDTIESRLVRLLQHLEGEAPKEEWIGFLDGDRPRWSKIAIAGISHGASTAGVIGLLRPCERVIMFSGPFDNVGGQPAFWLTATPQTPASRWLAFSHTADEQYAQHAVNWQARGLFGVPTSIDDAAPPFDGSHRLTTSAEPAAGGSGHGSTVGDAHTPLADDGTPAFAPVWRHLLIQTL
jgi:hypothetical protein